MISQEDGFGVAEVASLEKLGPSSLNWSETGLVAKLESLNSGGKRCQELEKVLPVTDRRLWIFFEIPIKI